ncbi:MAG: hypothetical protein ACLRSY_00415 [Acutalibacter sp.]
MIRVTGFEEDKPGDGRPETASSSAPSFRLRHRPEGGLIAIDLDEGDAPAGCASPAATTT